MATTLLVVAAVFQIFDGNQVINSAALRGLTDVKVPALITFVAYWVIALPVGLPPRHPLGLRARRHLDRPGRGPGRGGGHARSAVSSASRGRDPARLGLTGVQPAERLGRGRR